MTSGKGNAVRFCNNTRCCMFHIQKGKFILLSLATGCFMLGRRRMRNESEDLPICLQKTHLRGLQEFLNSLQLDITSTNYDFYIHSLTHHQCQESVPETIFY